MSIGCISSTQVQWKTKQLFNSNTGIFSRSWVEKKNPAWEDWINAFILREYYSVTGWIHFFMKIFLREISLKKCFIYFFFLVVLLEKITKKDAWGDWCLKILNLLIYYKKNVILLGNPICCLWTVYVSQNSKMGRKKDQETHKLDWKYFFPATSSYSR